LTIAEGTQNLVLHLPAIIKEKFIQQLIIVCLNDVIKLFEKNQLLIEVIENAKIMHDFEKKYKIMGNQININT